MSIHEQVATILVIQAIVYSYYVTCHAQWKARGGFPGEIPDPTFWTVMQAFGMLFTFMWGVIVLPIYFGLGNIFERGNPTADILGSYANQVFVYINLYCLVCTAYDFFKCNKKHVKSFIALFK